MTARRSPATVREHAAEPDSQAREVLHLFEAQAAGWAAKYAPDGPLAGRLAALSAAVHRYAQADSRILDLGCGTGELACALAATGLQVTGCDVSPQMLLRATRGPGQCAGWIQLDPSWRTLPFAAAAFDVVVAASVLEYVVEPRAVLRDCARVLRSGGIVIYTVPDLRHPVRWAEWCAQHVARKELSVTGGQSPWQRYRAYLGASRQRHRLQWWLAASASAGLHPLRYPGGAGQSTLKLLVFRSVAARLPGRKGSAFRAPREAAATVTFDYFAPAFEWASRPLKRWNRPPCSAIRRLWLVLNPLVWGNSRLGCTGSWIKFFLPSVTNRLSRSRNSLAFRDGLHWVRYRLESCICDLARFEDAVKTSLR